MVNSYRPASETLNSGSRSIYWHDLIPELPENYGPFLPVEGWYDAITALAKKMGVGILPHWEAENGVEEFKEFFAGIYPDWENQRLYLKRVDTTSHLFLLTLIHEVIHTLIYRSTCDEPNCMSADEDEAMLGVELLFAATLNMDPKKTILGQPIFRDVSDNLDGLKEVVDYYLDEASKYDYLSLEGLIFNCP